MEEKRQSNYVFLRGVLAGPPRFSHDNRGVRFYTFPLEVRRLSGVADTLNVVIREDLAALVEPQAAGKLFVRGELRSFNNKSGVGPKLIITVFARELGFDDGEDENDVELTGTICKAPNLRVTPMGREICDLMLAVNRRYGRSDYLPCIAWGARAREAGSWQVGQVVVLNGRMQSRIYTKQLETGSVEKTAYEVSVIDILPAEDADT